MQTTPRHVSKNAVQGSLVDSSVERLLAISRQQMITGRIDISTDDGDGFIELRAGVVDDAVFAGERGNAAVDAMRELAEGGYEISQRLPDLHGELGAAASFRGEVTNVSLVQLMRHCEDNALTCTVTLIHEFDRAEIHYKGGEIDRVTYNGITDDDKIVDIVRFEDARFLVSALPLDLGVEGWPVVRRAATEPFRLEHLSDRPPVNAKTVTPPPPAPATPAPTGLRARLARVLRRVLSWLEH